MAKPMQICKNQVERLKGIIQFDELPCDNLKIIVLFVCI